MPESGTAPRASRSPIPARPQVADVIVAAAFATISASVTIGVIEGAARWPALAIAGVHSGALVWRRIHPEAVLAVMGATAVLTVTLGWPPVILGLGALGGVHGLGSVRPPERALPVLAATAAVMVGVVLAADARVDTIVGNTLGLLVAWWLGDRQRRIGERADRAERESEDRARAAVAAERMRIARELHDVVAHALSVIAVQAGTGRVLIDSEPDLARDALVHIEGESRAALGEMRQLLAVLRSDGDAEPDPMQPSPGLADLESLVTTAGRDGLVVDLSQEGTPTAIPAGVELAAYRIVQEALTNVRRHSGARSAQVRLAWRPDGLDVEVVDDGRGAPGRRPKAGNGLVGMRERVAVYGGTLDVGHSPAGGFRVAAHLPAGDRSGVSPS
jgi:signal transduction histidine kinase